MSDIIRLWGVFYGKVKGLTANPRDLSSIINNYLISLIQPSGASIVPI